MREKKVEPFRLRKWRWPDAPKRVIYTCARPGRSEDDTKKNIDDAQVRRWLQGLPLSIDTIISLLGTKQDGTSEYRFYSFDHRTTTPETWLNGFGIRPLTVIERPTVDFTLVSNETIAAIREDLKQLVVSSNRAIIVDSGGVDRTGQVCESLDMSLLPAVGFD